jgi:DNA-binding NarL/FixJ family response regulator
MRKVRAVVTSEDKEQKKTAWFPEGAPEVREAMLSLARAQPGAFSVHWEFADVVGESASAGAVTSPSAELPERQREVLKLLADGHTAREIAGILHVSRKTVEFHKSVIKKKLDLHTTAELTRYAVKHGIARR